MERKVFEKIYDGSGYRPANFIASPSVNMNNLGFLYRKKEGYHDAIIVYSENKRDIEDFIDSLVIKSKKEIKHTKPLPQETYDYVLRRGERLKRIYLGYIKRGTVNYQVTVNNEEVYTEDMYRRVYLTTPIDEQLLMVPEITVYTYSLKADIKEDRF